VLPAGNALSVVDAAGTVVVQVPDAEKWVGKQVRDTPVFQARLRGEPYIEAIGIDGVSRIYALAKVENVPPPSMYYVSVGSSTDQAYRQVREALWRNVLLLLAVTGVALAIAWYGAEISVMRQIDQLVATSKKVAAGDRGVRAAGRGGAAEIRSLGQNFNAMLDALDMSERRYRKTLDSVHLIAVALDQRGNVTYCNDFLLELCGLRREELLGRNWFDAVLPNPAPVRAMFEQAMREGTFPLRYENEILIRRGERRLIHWYNTVLRDAAAQVLGSVSLGEDITERARLEERNREHLERLTQSEAEGRRLLALTESSRGALLNAFEDQQLAANALRESSATLEALTRRLLEVQETERRTLARELHDEVGGVLTAVKLNLQSLRRMPAGASGEAAIADGLALVDGAIQAVRSLSLELRPAVLDDLGLIPALKWYCERQAQRAGIPIELALAAIDLKSVPQLEGVCFRIVQEALTNALRHTHARRIQVALRRDDGRFVLEVADDGGGFDVAAARKRGLAGESSGLLGMEERVKLLGGRFDIDSAPGAGTRITVVFAMPEGGFG